jgi:hypothetical protein
MASHGRRGGPIASDVETSIDVGTEVKRLATEKGGGRLPPGDVFPGPYRIESLIDSGGMGDGYRAYDPHLRCTAALKKTKPNLLRDPYFRKRVALGVQAAAIINHPASVKRTSR